MNNCIVVLLSTYNGELYLDELLTSLLNQTYTNIKIIARDDGSSDKTVSILKKYKSVILLDSTKNVGVKKSFSILMEYALQFTDSNYFMFCDQDDIWEPEKVEKTYNKMRKLEIVFPKKPCLVHTDLSVVDDKLNLIHKSFWEYEHINPKYNSFNRLLIQNTITGCTILINRLLAKKSFPIPTNAIMHDWWIGLVASQFGRIAYVNISLVKYRQHNLNTIGAKGFDIPMVLSKFYKIFYKNNLYIKHMDINIKQAESFLTTYEPYLNIKTINMLKNFSSIGKKSFLGKREVLLRNKLFKQGFIRNVGLLSKI